MKKSTKIKQLNTKATNKALYGNQHKKWKNVAKELSDRHITLGDIVDPTSKKQYALMDIASKENLSLGEMTVLRQYAEAIYSGSTKAAEFIRDTMGEKPTNDISVVSTTSPLQDMTTEDLQLLLKFYKEQEGLTSDDTDLSTTD